MYIQILKGAPLGNQNAAGPHAPFTRGGSDDRIPRTPTQEKRHQKDLESENWHTRTMARMKDRSNDSLRFILRDASEAARAMRGMNSAKEGQYLDEAPYASMELNARAKHSAKAKKADNGLFGIYPK